MEQLQQLKASAAARRVERQQREEAEEAWLQEALQAIEAAQRDQERREEIRRAEVARRRDAKYATLRKALLQLNDLQEEIMLKAQTIEADEEKKTTAECHEDLVLSNEAAREELRVTTEVKIFNAEIEWQRDLRERALWSRQLQEEYKEVQKAFWCQFKGGDARLQQLVFEYQRENYERYQRWCRWRDSEREHFRWKVEEEQGVREELLDTSLQRYEENAADRELDLQKKHGAQRRWFHLVTAERIRLLSEIEMIEAEAGGDEDLDMA